MKLLCMRRNKTSRVFVPLLIMMAVFFVTACSKKVDDANFSALLEEIDTYISSGKVSDALTALNSASKKVYSSNARLSIYKRYVLLNEDAKAGKVLANGIKALKDDKELCAVYAHYLLRHGKAKEAVKVSSSLQGTSYGSVNAEATLRSSVDNASYHDSRYIQTYIDSFNRTKNGYWLRNAAALLMGSDKKAEAVALYPNEMQSSEDALFWACVFYDKKDYGSALDAIKQAKELEGFEKTSVELDTKLAALESDSYILYGDEQKAYDIRTKLLTTHTLSSSDSSYSLVPSLLVNNAYWDKKHGDYVSRYTTLNKLITQWQSFVPALIAYGNYALETSEMSENDPLTVEVRKTGLRSLDMLQYDKITKIPVEDALYQMKDLHAPELVAVRQRLLDASKKDRSLNEKISSVYDAIEGTETATNLYPPLLAEYAVERLLELGQYDEAKALFCNYIKSRYSDSENIWENVEQFDYWELECKAYFEAVEGDVEKAIILYEYLVFKAQRKSVSFVTSSNGNGYAVEPLVNLAVIYDVLGRKQEAMKLYRDASSSTDDNYTKAEILYRIACIHREQGEGENAVSVLQYCLDLNPGHEKARQMYRILSR